VVDSQTRLDPERFLEFLIQERITDLFIPFVVLENLARAALERFHPLVGAFALLPRPEALALARRVWRDLKFPLRPEFPSADPAAVAAARWFREQELAEVEGYLVREGVLLADLAAPLAPSEPENTQHCERCEAQFLPQATGWIASLSQFINTGGTIKIELAPETELTATEFSGAGPETGMTGSPDLPELVSLLGLSVTHTPASETAAGSP
jgi:hypothetical protein